MKLIALLTIYLLTFPVCFGAADSIQKLTEQYAKAYLREDVTAIIRLRFDAWDLCKKSEFNTLLRSRAGSVTFESKKFYKDYRLEVQEVVKENGDAVFGFWEGIGQIEYYPLEPTHKAIFWAKEGGMASVPIVNSGGKWYTVHTCAGKDAGKFLELEKLFDEK